MASNWRVAYFMMAVPVNYTMLSHCYICVDDCVMTGGLFLFEKEDAFFISDNDVGFSIAVEVLYQHL